MDKVIAHISGIKKLTNQALDILSSISSVCYVKINSESELKKSLKNCDIFWFRLNHKITEEVLKNARCKYILCAVTGLDHIDIIACKKYNIKVISLKNEKEFLKEVRATAEHNFGLLLALIRKSKSAFKHVESYQWNRNLFQGEELYKKKIGILGLGRLGKIIAEYANVFGMEVYYHDKIDFEESIYTNCESLEDLITQVDILSINITYDDTTHFIINKRILSKIKKSLYIVNTSRGGVVNEDDIITFLNKGKIKGYATDVLYGEPDIEENKLIKYAEENENVIITPHISGYTKESIEKTEIFIANKFLKNFNKN
ncbi:NAD(P)-dependent oxidoreductase [Polaribacter aquimarinus]|uniref:Hydroxyacid dehydrogenase n=1 Tax=Polaribacter aquimarinus TaxID=2100726 RepID=A0A2U2J7L4_9FLAO|nr:D-isomer specific 2-hydroxyacid dehydrogenase family protein [Polaribacter aquimarinus]PWG04281.1 hypothetical protein DIS07_12775 [Polaribacter aquimarinus]